MTPDSGMMDMSSAEDMTPDQARDMPADMLVPDASVDMSDSGDPVDLGPEQIALFGARCTDTNVSMDDRVSPGSFELGAFSVQVEPSGHFVVTHPDSPARRIFATDTSAPLVEATSTRLEVTELQGSFDLTSENLKTCLVPELEDLYMTSDGLVLQGGFADSEPRCERLRFEIQLCEDPDLPGHMLFEVTTDGEEFDFLVLRPESEAEERIHGLGLQIPHDTLDMKGRSVPLLAQEGGVGRGQRIITPAVNTASPGSGGKEYSSYAPAPHYITDAMRSVALENTEYTIFDFRQDEHLALRIFAHSMRGRIMQGNSPLELVERHTAWAGRMPEPPAWIDEGAVVALARDLPESEQIIDDLQGAGAHISAVWNQTWSGTSTTFIGEQVLWNWIQNPRRHPDWAGFVDRLDQKGVRTLCYINSMFRDISDVEGEESARRNLFAEASEAGYLVKKEDGRDYLIAVTAFDVGLLDLTNPEARAWMKQIIREEMIDAAKCSGWMADFAEALPFEAHLHSGEEASAHHNQYPVDWAKLNREAVEEAGKLGEILVFNRSGWTQTPQHSLMMWQGDQLTTWDRYDGMRSALRGLINGGFSGFALNHSDIGGYTSLTRFGLGYKRGRELLERWTEMNAFTTMMRTHEGNQPGENAQIYDDASSRAHFALMTKIYVSLAPYRRALFAEAATTGAPVVRHLAMHYPEDARAWDQNDSFLLGADVLVAPVMEECKDRCDELEVDVYLPAGEWVHLWSEATLGDPSQGVDVRVSAPIGQPPVFYRKGAPMAQPWLDALRAEGVID